MTAPTIDQLTHVMSEDVYMPIATLTANVAGMWRIKTENKEVRQTLKSMIRRGLVDVTAGMGGSPAKYKLRRV